METWRAVRCFSAKFLQFKSAPSNKNIAHFNAFQANVPILYPLKTPENQRFSVVFRGYEIGTLTRNGLIGWIEQVK